MSSLFQKQKLIVLTDTNFDCSVENDLKLKDKNCCLVLFHNNNPESQYLIDLLDIIMNKTIGANFMTCDLDVNYNIKDLLISYLRFHPENQISFTNDSLPLISFYVGGKFQGLYHGNFNEYDIINYISGVVCSSSLI